MARSSARASTLMRLLPTELLSRLDEIEGQVNKMNMPLAYAEQFYVLRDHIKFVSDRYREGGEGH